MPRIGSDPATYVYDGKNLWRRPSIQYIQELEPSDVDDNLSMVFLFGREEGILSPLTVSQWAKILGHPLPALHNNSRRIRE